MIIHTRVYGAEFVESMSTNRRTRRNDGSEKKGKMPRTGAKNAEHPALFSRTEKCSQERRTEF